MGLFGRKKKVRCVSCSTELNTNEAVKVDGAYYCSACDSQRRAAAARAAQPEPKPEVRPEPKKAPEPVKTGSSGVHPSIADIQRVFDAHNLHYRTNNLDDTWELVAGVNGEACSYNVKFISTSAEQNNVAVRVFALANIPEGREAATRRVLNQFQQEYRFLQFVLDSDNDVNLDYDLPDCSENVGEICSEMLVRIMRIVDDVYPKLMRGIWA